MTDTLPPDIEQLLETMLRREPVADLRTLNSLDAAEVVEGYSGGRDNFHCGDIWTLISLMYREYCRARLAEIRKHHLATTPENAG